eukprot:496648-Rhodomonas_salina.1
MTRPRQPQSIATRHVRHIIALDCKQCAKTDTYIPSADPWTPTCSSSRHCPQTRGGGVADAALSGGFGGGDEGACHTDVCGRDRVPTARVQTGERNRHHGLVLVGSLRIWLTMRNLELTARVASTRYKPFVQEMGYGPDIRLVNDGGVMISMRVQLDW